MIEIKNIFAGWLTFELHYGEISELFTVSYLDDFRDSINYLLGINRNGENPEYIYSYKWGMEGRSIILDGEGTELKLSISKNEFEDNFCLTWWLNNDIPVSMVFSYQEFVEAWIKEINKYEESYEKDFLMDYEDEDE